MCGGRPLMKTAALYIPFVFVLIFLSYLLGYAVLDPGSRGLYMSVGGERATAFWEFNSQVVIHLSERRKLRLGEEELTGRSLKQHLAMIYERGL